jgi:hypothetical protein
MQPATCRKGTSLAPDLRNRIRARFTELYAERTSIETELAALGAPPAEQDNPAPLDELPILGDILSDAPAALTGKLLAAFDIKAVYNRDKHQVTITPPSPAPPPGRNRPVGRPPRRPQHPASAGTINRHPRSFWPFDPAHWVALPGLYSAGHVRCHCRTYQCR